MRAYHKQLLQVLSIFASANERLRNITLPLGPTKSICVDIVTCILLVIQDMQEGDLLCGQYGLHSSGIQRHCRACNVNYVNLNNHLVQCSYLTADMLMNEIAVAGDVRHANVGRNIALTTHLRMCHLPTPFAVSLELHQRKLCIVFAKE